ncbi:hypothetical protein D3C76_1184350 [compost metagenome]
MAREHGDGNEHRHQPHGDHQLAIDPRTQQARQPRTRQTTKGRQAERPADIHAADTLVSRQLVDEAPYAVDGDLHEQHAHQRSTPRARRTTLGRRGFATGQQRRRATRQHQAGATDEQVPQAKRAQGGHRATLRGQQRQRCGKQRVLWRLQQQHQPERSVLVGQAAQRGHRIGIHQPRTGAGRQAHDQ